MAPVPQSGSGCRSWKQAFGPPGIFRYGDGVVSLVLRNQRRCFPRRHPLHPLVSFGAAAIPHCMKSRIDYGKAALVLLARRTRIRTDGSVREFVLDGIGGDVPASNPCIDDLLSGSSSKLPLHGCVFRDIRKSVHHRLGIDGQLYTAISGQLAPEYAPSKVLARNQPVRDR